MRHREGTGSQAVGSQFAARIESKPADPQHGRAQRRIGQVMWRHRLAAESQSLANQQSTNQGRNARADVHHGAAGKVQGTAHQPMPHAGLEISCSDEGQESTPPDPMAQWTVDQRAPEYREHDHRAEFHPFRKGTANQRRRNDEKHALE